MKICVLGNAESVHNQKWCENIAGLGHEVWLITLQKPVVIPGVRVVSLYSRWSRYLDIAFKIKKSEIKKIVEKIRPDILHGQFLSDYGYYAAALNYHPLVVSVWGSDLLIYPWLNSSCKKRIEQVVARADRITVGAEYLKSMLISRFKVKKTDISIVTLGVKNGIFGSKKPRDILRTRNKYNVKKNERVIFSPRNMGQVYGILQIIDAIPAVLKKYPETIFIFASGYADPKYLKMAEDRVKAAGIGKNVRIIRSIINVRDLALLYSSSDIFISASFSDAVSVSVMEGMLSDSVPLLSDIDANKELVKNGRNGFLFKSGDSFDLEKKLLYLMGLPESKKKIFREKNRLFIERKYTMKSTMKALNKVYYELTGKK